MKIINVQSQSARSSYLRSFVLQAFKFTAICLLIATVPVEFAHSKLTRVCTGGELALAISSAKSGDTIEMCNREWRNTEIKFDVDGSKNAPIRLIAASPGEVVLTGSSRLLISGKFAVADGLSFKGRYSGNAGTIVEFQSASGRNCNDCRVTNLTMVEYNPSSSSRMIRWVVLHGKRNRVDHSHFKGKFSLGAMIQAKRGADQSPNNHRIDHNLLEDRPDFTGAGNQNSDTLEIGSTGKFSHGTAGTVVEFNYLRNIDSDYELITIKSSGNTVQYNTLESSRGNISLRQGSNNTVHGNFILGRGKDRTGGIRIRGKDHIVTSNYISDINPSGNRAYSAMSITAGTNEVINNGGAGTAPYYKFGRADNVRIENNTILGSGLSVTFGSGAPNPPRNIELSNNILVQRSGNAIVDMGMGPNISFSNNLFSGANLGIKQSGISNVDPKLVKDASGIHRPTSQSPAIDAVLSATKVSLDMDGQVRLSPQDIGADEVVAGEPPRGMIEVCGVGPRTYRIGLPATCENKSFDEAGRPMPPTALSSLN